MALNIKNVGHCRRCIAITSRHLTDSATGRDATTLARKLSDDSLNILKRSKMSMQSRLKILSQLREIFNKSVNGNTKNMQVVLNRDWIDFIQRLTYTQIETIRKYSVIDDNKSNKNDEKLEATKEKKSKKPMVVNKAVEIAIHKDDELMVPEQEEQRIQSTANGQDLKGDDMYSNPRSFTSMMPKFGAKEKDFAIQVVPKWKVNDGNMVTKNSITSRTKHILNGIATAKSTATKWRRVEDLLLHIERFPEARHTAYKENGIKVLLKIQQSVKDEQILGSIREALSVLGYVNPVPGKGIRILSIDGGGVRGVVVVEMLKKLEELTGKRVHEMFDYICGVSTGAILSATLAFNRHEEGGHKRKSLSEISKLYKELSTKIFTQSAIKGTSNLMWSHAYYDTQLWEKLLQDHLGNRDLIKTTRDRIAPKFSAVSAVVNHERVMPYVFRNYTLPTGVESQYLGSHKHKVWQAVRASAAAPSYFEEYKIGDYLHQDGGIMVNNPCAVAIHEAKQLWPNTPIQCVVSCGTGRTSFSGNSVSEEMKEASLSSWKDKFYKILDSATDTEAVHVMLNDLLPDHVYYRFNPYLAEMLSMVEIRPEKISQLEQDATMYIRRNDEKFKKAAEILKKKKSLTNEVLDWVKLQKIMLG